MSVFIIPEWCNGSRQGYSMRCLDDQDAIDYARSLRGHEGVQTLEQAKDVICNHCDPTSDSYCFSLEEACGIMFDELDLLSELVDWCLEGTEKEELLAITTGDSIDYVKAADELLNFSESEYKNLTDEDKLYFKSFVKQFADILILTQPKNE